MHVSVLLQEVIKFLDPQPGKHFLDATFGAGGHGKEILKLGANVLGIDRDPTVIDSLESESKSHEGKLKIVQGNFADLSQIANTQKLHKVDGILIDLGFGSHQLDDASRGFSFQKEGPLDMRYDQQSRDLSATEIINKYPESDLIRIFRENGEERRLAKGLARAILKTRAEKPILTTIELLEIIKNVLPAKLRFRASDLARKIFQALRIEVNHELQNLEKALPQAVDLLTQGGRLVVISFHSLEDRIVKQFFLSRSKDCVCPPRFPVCRCDAKATLRVLTRKPVRPTSKEVEKNPRARSAKLRVALKI